MPLIIHIDMDAFFAAIEQREDPALRGRPVVVGADPKGGKGRGVVSTCSYEARKFGIHSAQPISEAWRRCPHAVFVPVRGKLYREVSNQVFKVFEEFTPVIEPISIDEAFLDVTGSVHLWGTPRRLAERIQERIVEVTSLTGSLGVAPCKMVAKIASDLEKPRGLVVVEPGEVQAFLDPLPVSRLWGVGKKMREGLSRLAVETIGELARCDLDVLTDRFGVHGRHLWELANGRDPRPVETEEAVKSIGHEHTYEVDTDDRAALEATLMSLCEGVADRMWRKGFQGKTVTTKIRFEDFSTFTRRCSVRAAVVTATEIYENAWANLSRVDLGSRRVRLIGVSVSGLAPRRDAHQLGLFDELDAHERNADERKRALADAVARIRQKHGPGAIHQATAMQKPRSDEAAEREEEGPQRQTKGGG